MGWLQAFERQHPLKVEQLLKIDYFGAVSLFIEADAIDLIDGFPVLNRIWHCGFVMIERHLLLLGIVGKQSF